MTDYEQLIDDLRQADNLTADHRILSLTDRAANALEELTKPKRGEIVRCGECKHHSHCIRYRMTPKNNDWFCGDGKREV